MPAANHCILDILTQLNKPLRACSQVTAHDAGDWLASIVLALLASLARPPSFGPSSNGPVQALEAQGAAELPASAAWGSTPQALQAADPAMHPGPAPGCMERPAPAAAPAEPGPRARSPEPDPDPGTNELRAALAALDSLTAMAASLAATGPPAMAAGTAHRLAAGLGALLGRAGTGDVQAHAASALHRCDRPACIMICALL